MKSDSRKLFGSSRPIKERTLRPSSPEKKGRFRLDVWPATSEKQGHKAACLLNAGFVASYDAWEEAVF